MFTGLIQQIGEIKDIRSTGTDAELYLHAGFTELLEGESIAVDGACLTVSKITDGGFVANASSETLVRTTLRHFKKGTKVHLERAMTLSERLGGHLVSGHVDGVGKLISHQRAGHAMKVTLEVPSELAPFIAPKGAVAVNGVSLTVNEVSGHRFGVTLVPYTRGATLLDKKPEGSPVNIEVDILAKYIARLLGKPGVTGTSGDGEINLDFLARQGFL
jgi:riboflavin synthase